jgi:hypothetical protein
MKKLLSMFLFLFAGFCSTTYAQVIVIANPSVTSDSVSKAELINVFTGASSSLKGGIHVTPVLLKQGAAHVEFLGKYLDKNAVSFLIAWRGLVMTGHATMPRTYETDGEVVAYIGRTPGTIGYISKSTPHDEVKVLERNQSPCILMNFVEGRRSLVLAST